MQSSIDYLCHLLETPHNKVLMVIDTSSSSLPSYYEEIFKDLKVARRLFDSEGYRLVATPDGFSPGREAVALPLSAVSAREIPSDQFRVGGGPVHALVGLQSTALFQSMQPTHVIYASDLYDIPPRKEHLADGVDVAFFVMGCQQEKVLLEFCEMYAHVGPVIPMSSDRERDYRVALAAASALDKQTIAPLRQQPKSRF